MMSLGKFEESCQIDKYVSNVLPKSNYLVDAEFVSSFIGYRT